VQIYEYRKYPIVAINERSMVRTIFLYSFGMGVVLFLLKLLEFKFFSRELTVEMYIGAIALFFTLFGAWVGSRHLVRKKIVTVNAKKDFSISEQNLKSFGLSKREHEVLHLMAEGLSNQEIGDKLFISLSTVKTHTASLFVKLDAKRRTQAIQKGKELGLIP